MTKNKILTIGLFILATAFLLPFQAAHASLPGFEWEPPAIGNFLVGWETMPDPSNRDTVNDVLIWAGGHSLVTGDRIFFENGGAGNGIEADHVYVVVVSSFTDLKLCESENFKNGACLFPVDMLNGSIMPSGAEHEKALETVDQSSAINTEDDLINVAHTYPNPERMAVRLATTGVMPGGLTAYETYYAIKIDDTHVQLATSLENAQAGIKVDLTSVGSGNLAIHFVAEKLSEQYVFYSNTSGSYDGRKISINPSCKNCLEFSSSYYIVSPFNEIPTDFSGELHRAGGSALSLVSSTNDSVTVSWTENASMPVDTYIVVISAFFGTPVPTQYFLEEIEVGKVTSYTYYFHQSGYREIEVLAKHGRKEISRVSNGVGTNFAITLSETETTTFEAEDYVMENSIFCPGYNPALLCCGVCERKWKKAIVDGRSVIKAGRGNMANTCQPQDEGVFFSFRVPTSGNYKMSLVANSPQGLSTDEIYYYEKPLGWGIAKPTTCLRKLKATESGSGIWTEPSINLWLASGYQTVNLFIADGDVSIDKVKFKKNIWGSSVPFCPGITPACTAGTNTADPTIYLSWNECVDDGVGSINYEIFRDTADSLDVNDTKFLTMDLNFENTGLLSNTRYYYGLRACNNYGCSAITPSCNATTTSFSQTDANRDGRVNIKDIQEVIRCIINSGSCNFPGRSDVNGDGSVNIKDIQAIIKKIINPS